MLIKKQLTNTIFNKKFVLVSSSKSRYKLLNNNHLNFSTLNPNCDERILKKKLIKKNYNPQKISIELAKAKAKSIKNKTKKNLVVGCDTVIEFNGVLVDKARNMKEAKKNLQNFSNKTHTIFSSVVVLKNNKIYWKNTQKTSIKIRKLTNKEINRYLKIVGTDILSSVGCYQIEKKGPNIIENIKGDFFNVMGFPLFPFLAFLKKQNKTPIKKND